MKKYICINLYKTRGCGGLIIGKGSEVYINPIVDLGYHDATLEDREFIINHWDVDRHFKEIDTKPDLQLRTAITKFDKVTDSRKWLITHHGIIANLLVYLEESEERIQKLEERIKTLSS